MASINLPEIIFGILLLLLGKKLFWLAVGIIGFVAGMELAPVFFPGYSESAVFILALALGLAGVVLALFSVWFAITAVGFLGVGYLFFIFFPTATYISFLVGGMIGVLLLALIFDSVLIIVSSIVGAALVSQNLYVSDPLRILILAVLAIAGIMIQSAMFPEEAE